MSPHCPNALVKRSQDLPTAYYDAGQFEFFSPDALLNLLDDSFSQYIGYILPRSRCVDIDTDEDWNIAEALFRSIHSILNVSLSPILGHSLSTLSGSCLFTNIHAK